MEEVYSDIHAVIRECEKDMALARPTSAAQAPPLDPLVALLRAVDHVSSRPVIGVELRPRLALLQHELLDNVEKAIQQRRCSPKGYLHVDIGVLERLRLEFTKILAAIKDDNQMRQVCPDLIQLGWDNALETCVLTLLTCGNDHFTVALGLQTVTNVGYNGIGKSLEWEMKRGLLALSSQLDEADESSELRGRCSTMVFNSSFK